MRDDDSPAQRAAALAQSTDDAHGHGESTKVAQPSASRDEADRLAAPDTGEIPVVQKANGNLSSDPNDPEVAKAIEREHEAKRKSATKRRHRLRITIVVTVLAVLLVAAGAGYGAYRWSQTQYYVGESGGDVAIYQGVPTDIFGLKLSHEIEHTSISTAALPQNWQDELRQGIVRDSLNEARSHVRLIRKELKSFKNTDGKNGSSSKNSSSDSSNEATDDSSQSSDSSSDSASDSSNAEQDGGRQ